MLVVVLIFIIIYTIKYIDANRESKTTKFAAYIIQTYLIRLQLFGTKVYNLKQLCIKSILYF